MHKQLWTAISILFLSVGLINCSAKQDSSPGKPLNAVATGTGSSSSTTLPGASSYESKMSIVSESSESIETYTHVRGSSWSTPCLVDLTATAVASRDIECVTEVNELDLFYVAFQLAYNIPTSKTYCAHLRFLPYHFFYLEPGMGPTAVTVTISVAGVKSITAQTPTAGAAAVTASLNSASELYCSHDYASARDDSTLPNCCIGTYYLTTIDNSAGGTTTTTKEDWGGLAANCLGGTGRDFNPHETTLWPRARLSRYSNTSSIMSESGPVSSMELQPIKVASNWTVRSQKMLEDLFDFGVNGIQEVFDAAARFTTAEFRAMDSAWQRSYVIATPESVDRSSNLHAANYIQTNTFATLPDAFSPPLGTTSFRPNPYYLFECLTETREVVGRVRLEVREWNDKAEFDLQTAGDPDTGGAEPGWPTPPPSGGYPVNDYDDWDDFIALGGFTGFPDTSW